MAFVHILSLPTSPHFSTQQHNLSLKTPLLKPITTFPNLSPPLSSLSLSTTRKPNRFTLFAATETLEIESDSVEETEVEREEEEDEGSRTRILAQNVPWTSTVDDLRALFEKYGTVVDIEMSMYNKTKNRGLAFVTMGSNAEALAVLSNIESSEFEGRTMKLTWAKPRKKKLPSTPKPAAIHNLYVSNLPFQARAKDLREFFKTDNANAVSAEIIFHENPRRSAGYGFVSFYTKEEADAALSAFQEKEFMGRRIRVAHSKRFLRQGTKDTIRAETESKTLSSNTEQSEEAN